MLVVSIYMIIGLILWIIGMFINWINGNKEWCIKTLFSLTGIVLMIYVMIAWPILIIKVNMKTNI